MFGGEPEEALERPGEEFARGHYEQLVEAAGTVRVGDERFDLHGYGLRDHSWGPRYWQAPWYYRWLTGNVGAGFGFMGSRIARRDGPGTRGGFVWDGAKLHLCHDFTIRTTWEGDARYHRTVEAELVTDARTWVVRGSVLALIPLRNRRPDPEGNELVTRISEGLTRLDPRRRAHRLRAVGVPGPDGRGVTGRPGRIGHGPRHRRHLRGTGRRMVGAPPSSAPGAGARLRARRPRWRARASTSDAGPVDTRLIWAASSSASMPPVPCSSSAGTRHRERCSSRPTSKRFRSAAPRCTAHGRT